MNMFNVLNRNECTRALLGGKQGVTHTWVWSNHGAMVVAPFHINEAVTCKAGTLPFGGW